MGFNCSIIGLPNVGKSTLFNALTATQAAEAANFPFCTKEPNIGRVSVPDARLDHIAKLSHSVKQTPLQVGFVDCAGLIRGASKGEGLGNRFLATIRELDAIIHVLRCFEASDILHVEGGIDPIHDAEIVETELMLADLQSIENRLATMAKHTRHKDHDQGDRRYQEFLLRRAYEVLTQGRPARDAFRDEEEKSTVPRLHLLTSKPVLYVCNVLESEVLAGNLWTEKIIAKAIREDAASVIISAALEAEVAQLASDEEKKEFLASFGLAQAGIQHVIQQGYALLDLITFFTSKVKETRAWTLPRQSTAAQAAGVVHSDFQRGFICAETIDYETYVSFGGEGACRTAGKIRQEGRDYVVKDGDILRFRFNV